MRHFSEAYEKCRAVLRDQTFESGWQTYLNVTTQATQVFKGEWLSGAGAGGLDSVRTKLGKGNEAAAEILKAAANGESVGQKWERAAALKLMKHLYLVATRGAQDVWIYSPPKKDEGWVFDELNLSDHALTVKLADEEEIFTVEQKNVMAHALQFAQTWCQAAASKVASPDDSAKAVIKRWFADASTKDEDLGTIATKLNDGFKKMDVMAGSCEVVLSDDPRDRKQGGQKWFNSYRALVYPGEAKPVIYIEGLWLSEADGVRDTGNDGQMWNLARTIIHELSHKAAPTDDICYAGHTLNPDATNTKRNGKTLNAANALKNADSWAYFCVDLAGVLPEARRKTVLNET